MKALVLVAMLAGQGSYIDLSGQSVTTPIHIDDSVLLLDNTNVAVFEFDAKPEIPFLVQSGGTTIAQFDKRGVLTCERVIERNPVPRYCPHREEIDSINSILLAMLVVIAIGMFRGWRLERVVKGEVKP